MPQFAALAGKPLAMSRRLTTEPNRQNSTATNWPRQVNPLALRVACCFRTAASKLARGINFRTWEKMLDTMDKAASSSDGEVPDKHNLSERRSRSLRFISISRIFNRKSHRGDLY
jgi:hypothetical protein